VLWKLYINKVHFYTIYSDPWNPDILATRMRSHYCMGARWISGIVCWSELPLRLGLRTCLAGALLSPV